MELVCRNQTGTEANSLLPNRRNYLIIFQENSPDLKKRYCNQQIKGLFHSNTPCLSRKKQKLQETYVAIKHKSN